MATNVEDEIDANVRYTEDMGTAPTEDEQSDTSDAGNGQNGNSRRTRLLNLGRLLLYLVCLGYSLYLIWLLAYLKDNNNYWFLSFIPILCIFWPFLLLCKAYHNNNFQKLGEGTFISKVPPPSYGVVVNLMACFTMLTRQAYYHRQPDEFVGPRFIILSLQASIILILLDFILERVRNRAHLLDYKDALIRMLLDFLDIFNMVAILSVNVCVGVGSFVSEDSSTEKAIQAFCTMSFVIVLPFWHNARIIMMSEDDEEQHSPGSFGQNLNLKLTILSGLYQDLPFLIIRIVVWVQYELYGLGFFVKNVTVIVLFIAILHKHGSRALIITYKFNNQQLVHCFSCAL